MSSFSSYQEAELTIPTESLLFGRGLLETASDGCAAWPCTCTAAPRALEPAVGSAAARRGKVHAQGCPPIPHPSHRKQGVGLFVYLFLLCHQESKSPLLSSEFFFT